MADPSGGYSWFTNDASDVTTVLQSLKTIVEETAASLLATRQPCLVYSRLITLNSLTKVSGTHANANYNNIKVSCAGDEWIEVSLIRFSTYVKWNSVTTVNNSWSFKNIATGVITGITIAPGNYSFANLAATIKNTYLATLAGVDCVYVSGQSGFRFTFPTSHQLIFSGATNAHELLGFPTTDTVSSTNNSIISTTNARARLIDSFSINIGGVTAYSAGYAMVGVQADENLTRLANIAIVSSPWNMLNYRPSPTDPSLRINEKSIAIQVEDDMLNTTADYVGANEVVLKFSVYR